MKKQKQAILIACPGQLRDSLHILLRAIPQIDCIYQLDICADDLERSEMEGHKCAPSLVLMDFTPSSGDALTMLQHFKRKNEQTRCIVLLNSEQEQPVAQAAGADMTFIKGVSATRLYGAIEELLKQ